MYFDDFKVQIANSNILEENHYYSYGLKIAGISSKRITDGYDGLAKNNYQYQGLFNEFDEDINWNDFQLRSYDAQVGRFVQVDPFDQFPSPYTGMANDPVNTIDPTGGIGIPCPGTSALSLFVSNVANSVINIASKISSIGGVGLSLGLAAAKAGVIVEQAVRTSNMINGQLATMQVGVVSSSSSSFIENANSSDNACQCPPGYSTKPKSGGDQSPYFGDFDEAALYWAYKMNKSGLIRGRAEYSSLILSLKVKNGKSTITLYKSTNPVRFDSDTKALEFSPGIDAPQHGSVPAGFLIAGHIHFHWAGSEGLSKGTKTSNTTFSTRDENNNQLYSDKFMYVLGSSGQLWGRYPNEMPLLSGGYPVPDPRAGTIPAAPVRAGLYDKNLAQPSLCACYKQ